MAGRSGISDGEHAPALGMTFHDKSTTTKLRCMTIFFRMYGCTMMKMSYASAIKFSWLVFTSWKLLLFIQPHQTALRASQLSNRTSNELSSRTPICEKKISQISKCPSNLGPSCPVLLVLKLDTSDYERK